MDITIFERDVLLIRSLNYALLTAWCENCISCKLLLDRNFRTGPLIAVVVSLYNMLRVTPMELLTSWKVLLAFYLSVFDASMGAYDCLPDTMSALFCPLSVEYAQNSIFPAVVILILVYKSLV